MSPEQKAALAEAVECLIDDADAVVLFRQLTGVYDLARKGVPVRMVGRSSVLNPLLVLRLEGFVRQEVRKPLHARAPGGFNFRLKPKKGNA